jgi:hypothetical protein
MRIGVAGLAGTVLLTISACGGGGTDASDEVADDSTLATQTSSPSPTTIATSEVPVTIPDGTYSRVVVRADAIAAGFDPALVDKFLGADGELPIALKVAGDRWTLFVTDDADFAEPGDGGSSSYDAEGRWVQISESQGCPGCVGVLEWSLSDGVLSLTLVPGEGQIYDDADRLMFTGDYEQGP